MGLGSGSSAARRRDHRWVGGHVNGCVEGQGVVSEHVMKVLSIGVITVLVASDKYVMIIHLYSIFIRSFLSRDEVGHSMGN